MKSKNAVEDQFDQLVAENVKDQYVFDIDILRGKDRQIIRTLKEHGIKDKKCLDIGPGTGRFIQFLKSENASLICAADISSEALNSCDKYVNESQKIDIENESLIFGDNSFDIIISFEVLEHLREPDNYISEIVRVAKDGAIVLISLPNITSLISRVRMLFGLLPVAIASDKTHVSFYRKKDLIKLFSEKKLTPTFLPTSISLNPFKVKSKLSMPSNNFISSFDDSLLFYMYVNK